jgi:hypothetical protein
MLCGVEGEGLGAGCCAASDKLTHPAKKRTGTRIFTVRIK